MKRPDWTPRALLLALWGCTASAAALYAGELEASARLLRDGEEGPEQAVLHPLATLAASAGWAGGLERWAKAREDWYSRDPGWGAVAPPPRPALPTQETQLEGVPELLVDNTPHGAIVQPRGAPSRILIIGASSIQGELGRALETQLEAREGLTVRRWGRHSTGLARADYFDWFAKGAELADGFSPDLVIAQMAGNDCQVMTDRDGTRVARFADGEAWDTAYAERLRDFVDLFTQRGSRVVVLGMPVMRSRAHSNNMRRINAVSQEAVSAADGRFISTWDWTANERGEYRGAATINGRERVTRADDGIHMTRHGANAVAVEILDELSREIDLPKAP